MTDDLTPPLTGAKGKPNTRRSLPTARILFGLLALIVMAFVARILMDR
ncbi:MAG: hypothetical protein MO852_09820 [Candidatus Devosia euplotis]|nr:hypothetical protein [Candidatus Devosia euplotis]